MKFTPVELSVEELWTVKGALINLEAEDATEQETKQAAMDKVTEALKEER